MFGISLSWTIAWNESWTLIQLSKEPSNVVNDIFGKLWPVSVVIVIGECELGSNVGANCSKVQAPIDERV